MRDGELHPNDDAPLIKRIYELRASGLSYGAIESEIGICYSTVRQILHNRVYRGDVRLRDQYFSGIHQPLVTPELFAAAHRGHISGRRRGSDPLSGRVRCGLCNGLITIDYNQRGQALFRCWHRGKGCDQPGRSAKGLHRAAALGLRLLATDSDLQTAVRAELNQHLAPTADPETPRRHHALAAATAKRHKLLELHYADQITSGAFAEEEARLTAKIDALRQAEADQTAQLQHKDELAQRFEEVATLLATLDLDQAWDAATPAERRVLVEELIDAVVIYPDHLEVHVTGAPRLNVTLAEVGLRGPSTRSSVSEGGLAHLRHARPPGT